MYQAVKHLHLTCVALSICGFVLRGVWMMTDSPLLRARLTRILPHVVDSLLLASALYLVSQLGGVPAWVWAKIGGLLVYIAFGMLALKAGRPLPVRVTALAAAVLTFAWIVSVAITKLPAGFFA
jgi:uncharacterized membrane protein SirB2